MRARIRPLTFNERLAAAALALGALAVFAQPMPGGTITLDARELAQAVQREAGRVDPLELADWLVRGRADLRLIDLRGEQAYAEYHLPGAEHVPLAALPDAALLRNETIVVYSDDDLAAAQAWVLLRALGFHGARVLRGGLDAWRDEVLFPVLAEDPTPFQAGRNARLEALARHFGGQPRRGDATVAPPPAAALPKVDAPAGPATSAAGPRKKKKEGC
jgi:rhodanese-related sulfurtransferase